jgi:hypothetical protein
MCLFFQSINLKKEKNMFGSIISGITKTAVDFVHDPVNTALNMAAQPIVDGCDLLQGLTEGEFREKAALRLGSEFVAGMVISEVIDAMSE